MNPTERAKKILSTISYITIATVSEDGQPWNSPVAAFHDHDLNFYWASWKENQHSKNIAANSKVFIVIYDSTAPTGTGEGVYILAEAEQLEDRASIETVLKLNSDPLNTEEAEKFLDHHPRRFYKAVPKQFWINDESDVEGDYVDVRIEIDRKDL